MNNYDLGFGRWSFGNLDDWNWGKRTNPYGREPGRRPLEMQSPHVRQHKRAKAKQIRCQKSHMRRMAR